MSEPSKIIPALRVSARIGRPKRTPVGRAGKLRERDKFVTDILVEDLSCSGCAIRVEDEIALGTTVSIELPGIGMQAARVVRSDGNIHGCAFLLPLSEGDVATALSTKEDEPISFLKVRERIRSGQGSEHDRRRVDGAMPGLLGKLLSRLR